MSDIEKKFDEQNFFNDILLDLTDIAWANGSIGPADQRQLAEDIARHVGIAKARIKEFIKNEVAK